MSWIAVVGDCLALRGAVTKRSHFMAPARLAKGAFDAATAVLPYKDADWLTKHFVVGDSRG